MVAYISHHNECSSAKSAMNSLKEASYWHYWCKPWKRLLATELNSLISQTIITLMIDGHKSQTTHAISTNI